MKFTRYFFLCLLFLVFFLSSLSIMITGEKEKWNVVTHDTTNFPLIGRHRTVPCGDCHIGGILKGTPRECEACHWVRKLDDPYKLQLGLHCVECHNSFGWEIIKPNAWEHEHVTGYPLEGGHRNLECKQCHKGNQLFQVDDGCYSCHREEYEKSQNPDHVDAQFSLQCESCHKSSVSWEGAVFSHELFQLKGIHRIIDCEDCHTNNQYIGLSYDCVACHLEDYNQAKDPEHKNAGFSPDCVSCHGDEALTWKNAVFDHNQYFEIQGAHKILDCSDCHSTGENPPTLCYGCHQQDFKSATDPDHISAGFPTDCEVCHFASHLIWRQAVFSHTFPIDSGKHSSLNCSDCHLTANYMVFSCISCHEHNEEKMDDEHDDESGYSYNTLACYSCHPSGKK
jgi:hypothetical protein